MRVGHWRPIGATTHVSSSSLETWFPWSQPLRELHLLGLCALRRAAGVSDRRNRKLGGARRVDLRFDSLIRVGINAMRVFRNRCAPPSWSMASGSLGAHTNVDRMGGDGVDSPRRRHRYGPEVPRASVWSPSLMKQTEQLVCSVPVARRIPRVTRRDGVLEAIRIPESVVARTGDAAWRSFGARFTATLSAKLRTAGSRMSEIRSRLTD